MIGELPHHEDSALLALRGAVVGTAVAAAVFVLWRPVASCEAEGLGCLGTAVIAIFLMPIVALLVGLGVGAALRIRRPWLLALVGLVLGYAALRIATVLTEDETRLIIIAGVLVIPAYAGFAVLLRPTTRPWVMITAAVALLAAVYVPPWVAERIQDHDRAVTFDQLGVPLLLAEVPGFVLTGPVVASPGGEIEGEVANLRYDIHEPEREGDVTPPRISIDVVRMDSVPTGCDDLPEALLDDRCEVVGPGRWLIERADGESDDQGSRALVLAAEGGLLVARSWEGATEEDLRALQVRTVDGEELARLEYGGRF